MKNYLLFNFLTIQVLLGGGLCFHSLCAAPPLTSNSFFPTNITNYSNGIVNLKVQVPNNAPLPTCSYIFENGEYRRGTDIYHQFYTGGSIIQWQIDKKPERPDWKMLNTNSGQNSPFLYSPSSSIWGPSNNPFSNPSLHIEGAVDLFSVFNLYNTIAPNVTDSELIKVQEGLMEKFDPEDFFRFPDEERRSYLQKAAKKYLPYYIAVVAIENDFCEKGEVSGRITLTTNQNVAIEANNFIDNFTWINNNNTLPDVLIPSIWSGNTKIESISPKDNPNFTTTQEISIRFQDLKYGEQRFVYLFFDTNSSVPIGTNTEWNLKFETDSSSPCKRIEEDLIEILVQQYPHDPNEKLTSKPTMSPSVSSEDIIYKINFENIGEYYAEHILLVDDLPPGLNASTFEFIDSYNGVCPYIVIADRKVYIFLENTHLPGGEQTIPQYYAPEDCKGWVRFSIKNNGKHQNGESIENQVEIHFMGKIIEEICNPSTNFFTPSFIPVVDLPLLSLSDFVNQEAQTFSPTITDDFVTAWQLFIDDYPCTVVLNPVVTPPAKTNFTYLKKLYEENLIVERKGEKKWIRNGSFISTLNNETYRTEHLPWLVQDLTYCKISPIIISGSSKHEPKTLFTKMDISPNPFYTFFNLTFPFEELENMDDFELRIFDLEGRLKMSENTNNLYQYGNKLSLEVNQDLPSGVYILQIIDNKATTLVSRKIVKL